MCFSSGNSSGAAAASAQADAQAQAAAQAEAQRQGTISQDTSSIKNAFGGFDDNFFNNQSTAYQNYANPQLDDQYQTAKDQLSFALGREGLLDSSEGARQIAELSKQYDTNKQNIVDTGDQYANTARQNVAGTQSTLLQQAQNAEAPDSISSDLAARMPTLGALPAFSPLGDIFQNVSALAANSYAWQRAAQGGAVPATSGGGATLFPAPTRQPTTTVP